MKGTEEFLKDNPGIKLGEDIEEEIPVKKNVFNPKTKTVMSTYQLEKVRTRYIEAVPEKLACKQGEHIYKVADPKQWLFFCTKCPHSKRVFPTTHTFSKGKLIHKATGLRV